MAQEVNGKAHTQAQVSETPPIGNFIAAALAVVTILAVGAIFDYAWDYAASFFPRN